MSPVLARLTLVAAGTLAALLGFELFLRAIGYSAPFWREPDPSFGWKLRPGIQARYSDEGDALVAYNSAGWRDREHAIDKPDGVYRIVVLGDSYSEARQVALDKTFWALLPGALERCGFQGGRRIESLNFGVSGFSTAQEYLILESTAMRYRPDLVLLQFTNGNDVRDNSAELSRDAERPFFRLASGNELRLDDSFATSEAFRQNASSTSVLMRNLTDRSRLVQLARKARERGLAPRRPAESAPGVEQGLEPVVLRAPQAAEWERAWQVTEALVAKTRDHAKTHGADFLLVTVPYAIQVHPDAGARRSLEKRLGVPHLFYPDQRLAEFSERRGIAAVTLAPDMQRLADETGLYLHGFAKTGMGRGHWNEDGHRVAAQLIARRLCAGGKAKELRPVV